VATAQKIEAAPEKLPRADPDADAELAFAGDDIYPAPLESKSDDTQGNYCGCRCTLHFGSDAVPRTTPWGDLPRVSTAQSNAIVVQQMPS